MNEVTINIANFNKIEYLNAKILHGDLGYVTIAKDRDDQEGILLFIPSYDVETLIDELGD